MMDEAMVEFGKWCRQHGVPFDVQQEAMRYALRSVRNAAGQQGWEIRVWARWLPLERWKDIPMEGH